VVAALQQAGFDSNERILGATMNELMAVEGVDAETAEAVVAAARAAQAARADIAAAELEDATPDQETTAAEPPVDDPESATRE
jgi:hypothetical protein